MSKRSNPTQRSPIFCESWLPCDHQLSGKCGSIQQLLCTHVSTWITELHLVTYSIPRSGFILIHLWRSRKLSVKLCFVRLQLEHQMAEESIDSGVSSEHSQYTFELKSSTETVKKSTDLCAEQWNPNCSCPNHGEGYYGPKPPPYCSNIHSDSSLDYGKGSCLKRIYRQRNNSHHHSIELHSDSELSGSVLSNPIHSAQRGSQRPKVQIPGFDYFRNMSSNPRDYSNGSIGPQRSNIYSDVAGTRGADNRVVHFAREQRDVEEKARFARPSLPESVVDERISVTGARSRTSLPEYVRPPLVRNYSARDYVYLPAMQQGQMASSVPILTRQQTSRSLLSTDHTFETPQAQQMQENRTIVQNQQVSEMPPSQAMLDNLTRDVASMNLGNDQQKQQLLSALLAAAKSSTLSTSNTTMLQNLLQRIYPKPSTSVSRPAPSARWSDTDMTDGQRLQNLRTQQLQQQQNQQRLLQQQRQQQAAAAAAAAAAAVAIATMQCAPRSTGSTVSTTDRSGAMTTQPLRRIPPRSCYSSGDEDLNVSSASVLSGLVNQFVQYRAGLPSSKQDGSTGFPPAHSLGNAPVQSPPTSSGHLTGQLHGQMQTPGSAEDYANYQSLDAILGKMHQQPPPPAPFQPMDTQPFTDFYQTKSTIPDESFSVHSSTCIPAHSTHSMPCLPPLHIDPTECRLPDAQMESRPEDRFWDFMLLPSERCVATTYSQATGAGSHPLSEWSHPDYSPSSSQPPMGSHNGLLVVHLVAGNGLSSSQTMLRDLYCVVEMDSIRKARSMIRTSSSFFEWNEVFELDMEDSRFLAFLLYQWDPRTKHRLCFYGGIDLRNLVSRLTNLPKKSSSMYTTPATTTGQKRYQQLLLSPALTLIPSSFEKIALQLEPRGVLYLEFGHYPLERIYHRYQPTVSTSLQHSSISDDVLFGVPIDELIERERNIVQLTSGLGRSTAGAVRFMHDCLYIPLFIRKCVEEIDRRGTDVVGIYRLAGSVWMKLQVRELFNQVTKSTLRAIFQGDRKALEGITGSIDLSPARVPDIHAITALFKDFLRELPEPLFTSALYPMFYDAMQVTLPDFSQSGAKLMLNILDCLPTNNQEILLYLLDHFKRITNQSDVNKMNTHNLANCLAPVLFYPAPNSARNMDPAILEPRKMAEIFQFILEIWPDERKPSGIHSWPPQPYRLTSPDETLARHAMYRSHRHKPGQSHYRASSSVRSTLSGPAAPGAGDHIAQFETRPVNFASSERSTYMGMGRSGRMKFTSASLPVQRRTEDDPNQPRRPHLDRPSGYPNPPQPGRSTSQTNIPTRRTQEMEALMFQNLSEEQARKDRHPRFQDIPTTGSTDSGTRSSFSAGGHFGASTSRQAPPAKRSTRPESTRSFSHEREVYSHSPRASRRSQPFT